MADIVNLRLRRKRATRVASDAVAAENRQSYGVSKPERIRTEAERDKANHMLDLHRIEPGDPR